MADNLTDGGGPTAAALLERAAARLAAASASPQLDAQLLLCHVLGCPRSHLLAWPERRLDQAQHAALERLLTRAAKGEPLAYLTGEREFWSLPLQVSPAVLIPRPETELLVERCLALGDAAPQAPRVVDLGTGSGAIALALARERPAWRLTATDRSAEALRMARANAERLRLGQIEFLEGDWFGPLTGRRFELVASNPPYIASADPALRALRFEPQGALTPGADGLAALTRLLQEAPSHLAAGGWLLLEHGADQGDELAQRLRAAGYARIGQYHDLAGHVRVTEAQWP